MSTLSIAGTWQRLRATDGPPASPAVARYRTLGLVGALVLGVGGMFAGAYPQHRKDFSLSRVLFFTELATIAAYGGLVLLVVAWLRLGRLVGTPEGPDARELRRMIVRWATPLMIAPPLFSKDVYSYAAQGAMVLHHNDPYTYGPGNAPAFFSPLKYNVDDLWAETPAPYGPVFLVLAARMLRLTGENTIAAVFGLRVLCVLGVVLMVIYVPRLATHLGVDPNAALWLGVLNPLVLIHLVGGGHNDALLIGFMVMGLVLVLDGLPVIGVLMIALAMLVKAPAGLAFAFCIPLWAEQLSGRLRLTRATLLTGATALASVAGISAACGLGYGWINALQTPGQVRNWLSMTTTLGQFTGVLESVFGAGNHMDGTIAAWRGAGGLVAVLVCAVLLWRSRRIGPVPALGMGLIAVVALGPVVQPWYMLWGFVLLAAASLDPGVRSLVAGASAAMSLVLMPRGGPLEPRDIVEAILVGALVAGGAVLAERMLAARRYARLSSVDT
jgi:hypothetical protein